MSLVNSNMANAWRLHGKIMAIAWQTHGNRMANAWQPQRRAPAAGASTPCALATAWQTHGNGMYTVK